MRWGVITFPGSCDDHDVYEALKSELGQKVKKLGMTWDAVGAYNATTPAKRVSYAWKVYANLTRTHGEPRR